VFDALGFILCLSQQDLKVLKADTSEARTSFFATVCSLEGLNELTFKVGHIFLELLKEQVQPRLLL